MNWLLDSRWMERYGNFVNYLSQTQRPYADDRIIALFTASVREYPNEVFLYLENPWVEKVKS
ncbi:MAG: hypothetical protein M1162_01495 [Candidatus Thermoplasmatota archaeon]|nr:hypothetical protein [Candidatus Thermoplasmatota archaeon]